MVCIPNCANTTHTNRHSCEIRAIPAYWTFASVPVTANTHTHLAVCLTTGPKPLPQRALHIARSTACSFKWRYHLLSLKSSSSFLRLLPRLPVTFIPPFILPSITHCRRQFLRKMWPIQLAFRLLISCRIFLCSLTLSNLHFSHDRSNWSSPSFSSTTFQNFPGVSDLLPEASKFQHHIKLCSKCKTIICQNSIIRTSALLQELQLHVSKVSVTLNHARLQISRQIYDAYNRT